MRKSPWFTDGGDTGSHRRVTPPPPLHHPTVLWVLVQCRGGGSLRPEPRPQSFPLQDRRLSHLSERGISFVVNKKFRSICQLPDSFGLTLLPWPDTAVAIRVSSEVRLSVRVTAITSIWTSDTHLSSAYMTWKQAKVARGAWLIIW